MYTAECRTPPSSIARRRLPLDDGLAVLLGGDKSPFVANIARPQCPLDYSRQTEWKCFYRKTISKFANYSRKHIIFAVGMMIELLLQ